MKAHGALQPAFLAQPYVQHPVAVGIAEMMGMNLSAPKRRSIAKPKVMK